MSSSDKFRNNSAAALTPKTCYVGQHVYWLMWVDPTEPANNDYIGWYTYKKGCVPEIWSGVVERVTSKKIWVRNYPKLSANLYSCEQHAVTGAYERFCATCLPMARVTYPGITLGEASAVLRKLAELEFNLNASNNRTVVVDRSEPHLTRRR